MADFVNSIKLALADVSAARIVGWIALFVVLIVLSRVLSAVVGRVMRKTSKTQALADFVCKIVKFVLYFVSVLILCDTIGIPITSLLAVFSLLGLAVSLSVQSLLSNLVSGFSVLMLKPFDIGDYIETDIAGTVRSVGLFYTEILTVDNKTVYIPNEKIMGNRLINYNSEGVRRIDLEFNAGYEYDIELVKATIAEAIESVDTILKTPEPIVGVSEYGDSAVKYSVWVWTKSEDYFKSKFGLMDAVWESYRNNGVKMAYNRLEVEMINGDK